MIDPQAIIHPRANIADDVVVGPWTYVGCDVTIDSGTVIGPHVVIKGPTKIGKNNKIFQFASIGEDCQDKKYKGEPTWLEIGDHNIIREGCTIHRGTVQDNSVTKIGDDNLLMAYVHVAHDCVVGNHVVMANNASLAGHVVVNDRAVLGGFTVVHQFSTIGSYSMCGATSWVNLDVPAFVTVSGNPARARGLNFEGMRRNDFSNETMSFLKQAYKIVFRQGLVLKDALMQLRDLSRQSSEVQAFVDSIRQSQRGIIR